MRAWKHAVLLAGVLGTLCVFAPMLEVKQGKLPAVELSARQLSFGHERSRSRLERELPKLEKYLPSSLRSTQQDLRLVMEASRWAALAYVPPALLLLLGVAGILRRRFGRALGALTLLSGLASIGAWVGLRFGIRIALEESGLQHTQVALLFGAHVLILVGAVAAIAGLGALVRPDLGRRPPRAAAPPGLPPPPGPPPPGPPPGFPPPPAPPPMMPPAAAA